MRLDEAEAKKHLGKSRHGYTEVLCHVFCLESVVPDGLLDGGNWGPLCPFLGLSVEVGYAPCRIHL